MTGPSPFRARFRNRTPFRGLGLGGANPWSPLHLAPTALYDANNGGSSTQITDSSGNALAALAYAASTASPLYLAAPGDSPYVYLPGVANNFITTPDHDSLDITGDIEAWVRVTLPDWSPSSQLTLISKYDTGSARRTWRMDNSATGRLAVVWSVDGSAVTTPAASSFHGHVDGTGYWAGMALDVDNGSAGYSLNYYSLAAPATTTPTSAGATVISTATASPATSIVASAAPLDIGQFRSSGASSQSLVGYVERAIVRNGLDGIDVADFKAADCTQTGVTDSLGRVWTVNYGTSGLSAVVKSAAANDTAAGVITDGSNDYATGPTTAIPPLTASDACTLYCVARPRATMVANQTFFSTRVGTGAGVTLRMASATTVVADISDGTTTATTPAVTITPGTRYVLGVVIPATGGAYCFANTATGATVARTGGTETGGALTVFATNTPANFCRTHARVPYAAVPRDIGAGGIANLTSYYGGGV